MNPYTDPIFMKHFGAKRKLPTKNKTVLESIADFIDKLKADIDNIELDRRYSPDTTRCDAKIAALKAEIKHLCELRAAYLNKHNVKQLSIL